MNDLTKICLIACLAGAPLVVHADTDSVESDILARRGNGVVTQGDFIAKANKIPEKSRFAALRDRNRVRDVINTLLTRSQLAADAREAGFDKEEVVIGRMRLAAQAELAEAWMQHYVAQKQKADFEALAYQYYQLHGDELLSDAEIDVSHILISTKERDDEEAKALADSVYKQVAENPVSFDQLVMEYSEDPSAASNRGKFTGVKKGQMLGPFERTAFALQPGEISGPVKTQYGYHIIRLDDYTAPAPMSFDAVKQQLIERETTRHEERIKNDYLTRLTSLDVEMTEEALREMVRRLFGEEVLAPEAGTEKTE